MAWTVDQNKLQRTERCTLHPHICCLIKCRTPTGVSSVVHFLLHHPQIIWEPTQQDALLHSQGPSSVLWYQSFWKNAQQVCQGYWQHRRNTSMVFAVVLAENGLSRGCSWPCFCVQSLVESRQRPIRLALRISGKARIWSCKTNQKTGSHQHKSDLRALLRNNWRNRDHQELQTTERFHAKLRQVSS